MHLEMASSLPAAEACDVQVAAESHAKRAIKSILAIFMFPLLSPAVTIKRLHARLPINLPKPC
jgi:hypothetical protein